MSQATFQILSLLVSAATWVTTTIALLSFISLRAHQRAAYKPELTPIFQFIYGQPPSDLEPLPVHWVDTKF